MLGQTPCARAPHLRRRPFRGRCCTCRSPCHCPALPLRSPSRSCECTSWEPAQVIALVSDVLSSSHLLFRPVVFAGKLAAEYLKDQNYSVKWGVCGRNEQKVKDILGKLGVECPVEVADLVGLPAVALLLASSLLSSLPCGMQHRCYYARPADTLAAVATAHALLLLQLCAKSCFAACLAVE